jgi:hypothetical protein
VSPDPRDGAFLAGCRIAVDLLRLPEVENHWDRPSALARMSVGMLACHLGRQVVRADQIVRTPSSGRPLTDAAEHYRRARWVTATDLDDPANDRSLDETEARLGTSAMLSRTRSALASVERALQHGAAHDVVTIPWQGWALRRPDFLLTRMVEMVTHVDDLAHSIGVSTPAFPVDTYRPVLCLLAVLAADRHGQSALTSALTRRERMPTTISAF